VNLETQISAADANRLYYSARASDYDDCERCAVAESEAHRLREHLQAAAVLNPRLVRVLDAGGGTGNASSVLIELGFDPLVVDVSAHMLAHWQQKIKSLGRTPRVVVDDIANFLTQNDSEWDLIVFSSVLHHLEDPKQVLKLAARCIAPGGVLVTIFDPISAGRIGEKLRRIDWVLYAVRHDGASLGDAVRKRLERARRGAGRDIPNLGRLAERYATRGLDDCVLVETLRSEGLEIVRHSRLFSARMRITAAVFRMLKRPAEFSLIARRPYLR